MTGILKSSPVGIFCIAAIAYRILRIRIACLRRPRPPPPKTARFSSASQERRRSPFRHALELWPMTSRAARIAVIWVLALLTLWLGERFYRSYVPKAEVPPVVTTAGKLSDWEKSNIQLFVAAAPSVVSITTEQLRVNPFMGTEVAQGAGSGFIWDASGHVVTNFHVIEGASTVYVQLQAGEPIRARVVGGARQYDIAVVK